MVHEMESISTFTSKYGTVDLVFLCCGQISEVVVDLRWNDLKMEIDDLSEAKLIFSQHHSKSTN